MTRHPLTLPQATALYEKHDDLRGRPFDRTTEAIIECLAIAPYDDLNQHILMSQLGEVEDYKETLKDYEGSLFDVIVIARSPENRCRLLYKRLGDYLADMYCESE